MSIIAHYRDFTTAERESQSVLDKSGNGHVGSFAGDAAFTLIAGRGAALEFPAPNGGRMEVFDAPLLNPATAISFGAWFYRFDDTAAMLVDKNECYRLWFPDNSMKPAFALFIGSSWQEIYSPVALQQNQWQFIEASYDGAIMRLFAQGRELVSQPMTGSINGNNELLVMGDFRYGGYPMRGFMREVVLRDHAVDLAEHRQALKRDLRKSSASFIELFTLKAPSGDVHVTSYHEPIDITVYT